MVLAIYLVKSLGKVIYSFSNPGGTVAIDLGPCQIVYALLLAILFLILAGKRRYVLEVYSCERLSFLLV